MQEAFAELSCPDCGKAWEVDANDAPDPETAFDCPDCGTQRPLSEFARTGRDLEVLREL
jgi:predicted RNA-binding Zn-ribbon protein involved in translation (DUF1610 family)